MIEKEWFLNETLKDFDISLSPSVSSTCRCQIINVNLTVRRLVGNGLILQNECNLRFNLEYLIEVVVKVDGKS